jgi:hypothetical protein
MTLAILVGPFGFLCSTLDDSGYLGWALFVFYLRWLWLSWLGTFCVLASKDFLNYLDFQSFDFVSDESFYSRNMSWALKFDIYLSIKVFNFSVMNLNSHNFSGLWGSK